MTTRRSGLLPQNMFARSHLLRKLHHYFVVFQGCSRKHAPKVGFQCYLVITISLIVQSEISGGSIILTRRGGVG